MKADSRRAALAASTIFVAPAYAGNGNALEVSTVSTHPACVTGGEQVGGLDVDGNWIPRRTEGDLQALRRAYSTGRVVSGRNLDLPIIDERRYRDPFFDIHTRERTFSLAERIRLVYGRTDHRVIWTRPLTSDSVAYWSKRGVGQVRFRGGWQSFGQ